MQHVSVSQSARRSASLSLAPAMRSMLSANDRNVSRPPTAIVSMTFSVMHRLNLLQEKFEKAYKIQL